MRIRYLLLITLTVLILSGCRKSSDEFLSYGDTVSSEGYTLGNDLSEYDFFAKDLVIIPRENVLSEHDIIRSEAALLIDINNRQPIFSKNIYEKRYPASLTKLVTALVALKRGEMTDTVTISYNASHIPEPYAKLCGFQEGDTMTLDALMNCMLIYSGNDASVAIAEYLGGSEEQFVEIMNEEVKKLGANHSNFINSSGLHNENHYTTAYDIYLVFNELIKYDSFLSIIEKDTYTASYTDIRGVQQEKTFLTTNQYFRGNVPAPDNVQIKGGKSGTTSKAGNCMILLSEADDGTDYISLILKAADETALYAELSELYDMIVK